MTATRIAFLAIAFICATQTSNSAEINPWKVGDPLVKPALSDPSPFLPKAEEAARKKYPELFLGRFKGTVAIHVDLNIDGETLAASTVQYPAGPISERSGTKDQRDAVWDVTIHNAYTRPGALGSKFVGWFGPKRSNGLYLYYRVLKWPLDPTRSVDKVRSAVAKRYPEFFAPRILKATEDDTTESVVTVVMNDNGGIDAALLIENANAEEFSDRRTLDRFLELGLKPEQLAYRGHTFNRGDWLDRNLTAPILVIEYAWKRMNDDPPDEVLQSLDVFEGLSFSYLEQQKSHPPDEEFLKGYFPAIWREGLPSNVAGVWLLFDRDGHVLDTGTAMEADTRVIEEQFQKRYRGIRSNEITMAGVKTQSGSTINLYYLWVASDSPVVPPPKR